jgi:hypothetical protein
MRFDNRTIISALGAGVFLAACGNARESDCSDCTTVSSALTNSQVLGFEDSTGWSTTGGTLSSNSTFKTQGTKSLAVTEQGYIELTSVSLSTLSSVSPDIAFDIRLPSPQPNPYWYGQVQMLVSIPSQNLYNGYLGAVELTGMPLQTFNTVKFVVDSATRAKLGASYTDLKFKIVLNTPTGTARQYLIDNLRFLNSSEMAWPNSVSKATSDPWIAQHHGEITVMRPRVLALNFANPRSMDDMSTMLNDIRAAVREGTRPKGAENPASATFLDYDIAYKADLRDATPPADWPYNNSTLYPRQQPKQNEWGFNYSKLFTQEYANHYEIPDPQNPTHNLTLCELSERGLVHEVWVYADSLKPEPYGRAAEILGIQPFYDGNGQRVGTSMNKCAGNGCFDPEEVIPASCTRTLRIGWINSNRGVGCYLESLAHGNEGIGRSNDVPYLTTYFPEFAGFDLNARYNVPFDSWYACRLDPLLPPEQNGKIVFTSDHSLTYTNVFNFSNVLTSGGIPSYVAACGNVHFPPNATAHYDTGNLTSVQSTCNSYRTAGGPGHGDPSSPINASAWSQYGVTLAPDCVGAWAVYWWQRFPAIGTTAKDANGATMKNWWPFFYY